MPIDREIIQSLLEELKAYMNDLETMDFTMQELDESRDIQHLLNHRLHTAVEICTDIAMHIASALELPGRDTASDVIVLLGKHGMLEKDFADRFQKAPGLRNILIHGYAHVDYRHLFRDFKDNLNDIRTFANQVMTYLDKVK